MSEPEPDRDPDAQDGASRESADAGTDLREPAENDVRDADDEAESPAADEQPVGAPLGEDFSVERPPIEPERPHPENALFVVIGALGTVALLLSVFTPGLV